jgi:uncharacterized membrane protein
MVDPTPQPVSASSAGSAAPRSPAASVASGNGLAWWTEGWRLFALSPWVWIGITVAFVVIVTLLHFVPLLGSVAATVLSPVLAAGIMSGCRAQDRGGELTINHLFGGFSDRLTPLLVLGLLYLVGTMIILGVMFVIAIGTIGMSGIGALMSGDPAVATVTALATLGVGALLAVLVGLLIALPLMMAYWFAPALVMLRNDEPVAALRASFFACLANVVPMLVYSIIGLVLAIVASIPFGLGWFVLGPVFAASVYASYKDIFGTPA